MKKSAIREDVTYQTKNGSAARRVIAIVQDRSGLPGSVIWYDGQEGPWVRYMQERGPSKGSEGVLQLSSFASWAHSEDSGSAPDGIAALREKVATLRAELECAWTLVDAAADETASAPIRHHADRIKGVLLSAGSDPSIFA